MSHPEPLDAEEVPPSHEDLQVYVYPHGHEPLLWVHVDGGWRYAVVRARHVAADGRVAVRTEITMPTPRGDEGHYHRTYWWSRDRMRVIERPGGREPPVNTR